MSDVAQVSEVSAPEVPPVAGEAPASDSEPKNEKVRLNPPEGGFTAFPEGYDSNKHMPPRKKDFADPRTYFQWRISQHEKEIEKAKKQIEMIDKFGTDPDSLKKARSTERTIKSLLKLADDLPEGVSLKDMLGDSLGELEALLKG